MVSVQRRGPSLQKRPYQRILLAVIFLGTIVVWSGNSWPFLWEVEDHQQQLQPSQTSGQPDGSFATKDNLLQWCPVSSISTLTPEEVSPKAGSRHMVEPPAGGPLTLVCCSTTKGNFSVLLHHTWAPRGVKHLVEMIRSNYFSRDASSTIPLFRCTDACQFGLSSNPNMTKRFNGRLEDDPQWLPGGPSYRVNDAGVKRYPSGVWTFAGSGPNSRSNQMVITLKPNQFMGGGSPWEVPLGEFVGKESFALLPHLYTGYGEKGPSQKILREQGASDYVQTNWPLMDYILSCHVMDEVDDAGQT